MPSRANLHRLIVLVPVVLLLVIAVEARTSVDGFQPPACDIEAQESLSQWIGPLRQCKEAGEDRAKLLKVGEDWIDAFNKGLLPHLPNLDGWDTFGSGAKKQIAQARHTLWEAQTRDARTQLRMGAPLVAATRFITALEISEIAKWSDIVILNRSAMEQKSTVSQLSQVVPILSAREKQNIAPRVKHLMSLLRTSEEVRRLGAHEYREKVSDSDRPEPAEHQILLASHQSKSMTRAFSPEASDMVVTMRMAVRHQTKLRAMLNEILSACRERPIDAR